MEGSDGSWPLAIHHLGYVVDDLGNGAEHFARSFGAGPFLAIEHMNFDEATYRGESAQYDHSSAFGSWGPLLLELTVIHSTDPDALAEALTPQDRGVGHLGLVVDSPEEEVAKLGEVGCETFHTGRTGPAEATWLTGGELFGHPIEVLRRAPALEDFYAQVRAAAIDWDGSDLLRPIA